MTEFKLLFLRDKERGLIDEYTWRSLLAEDYSEVGGVDVPVAFLFWFVLGLHEQNGGFSVFFYLPDDHAYSVDLTLPR